MYTDAIGRSALQCTDRLAVVPKLAVEVVLDDEPAARAGPGRERFAARRRHRDAGRVLVGRRDESGRDVAEMVGARASIVDRHCLDAQPGLPDDVSVEVESGVLHRDRGAVRLRESCAQKRQRLGGAGGDDDLPGPGVDSPGTAEVVDEGASQLVAPAHVAVAEGARRGLGERSARASQPIRDGKGRDVRRAGPKVEPGRLGRTTMFGGCTDWSEVGHLGTRPLPGEQVALSDELVVGGSHGAPRHAEILGQHSRGGQHRARGQAAALDRRAQALFEAGPPPGSCRLDVQIEARTGPRNRHGIGPYR